MKKFVCAAVAVGSFNLFAETVTIHSGDVVALTNALVQYERNVANLIQLEPGDYDLTGIKMSDASGGAHLYVNYVNIKGLGETADETRLIGDGTLRIINVRNPGYQTGTYIRNLTLTNGYARTVAGDAESGKGGAIYGATGDGSYPYPRVENCTIIGCRADGSGGALQSAAYVWDSRLINNVSGVSGGAAFKPNWLYNCVLSGNSAAVYGGAVYSNDGSGTISNCTVTCNTAGSDGGGIANVKRLLDSYVATNTATANGGGVWSVACVDRCVIVGNTAYNGGGAFHANAIGVISNSTIVCNTSSSHGGGASYYATLVNTLVATNTAGADGGGIHNPKRIEGCTVEYNVSRGGRGGGICDGNAQCVVSNSFVVGNQALVGAGGGIAFAKTVAKTLVSGNITGGGGGGLYCVDSGSVAIDCTICSNKNTSTGTNGGGVNKYQVIGGEVFANYTAKLGGGCINSTNVKGAYVHDNYAGEKGGGLYTCTATDCVIERNYAPSALNCYSGTCTRCDIVLGSVSEGSYLNCRIRDAGKEITLENPYVEIVNKTNEYCLSSFFYCTNCLICDNALPKYNVYPFVMSKSGTTSTLVNCTVVSNRYGKTFYSSGTAKLNVENTVFFGNRSYYNYVDLYSVASEKQVVEGSIKFTNLAYGTSGELFGDMTKWTDDPTTLYKFGANGFPSKPGFMYEKDPEHPYALKRSSPLRNLGAYADWMASATDSRGEGYPRATDDHKVDLGCYQCWLPAEGALLLVR